MPLDLSQNRPLPFYLRSGLPQNEAISDTPVPQLNWPTTDDDLQVPIVIKLSLKEYATLASAVDVGRDIAYGHDSDKVWLLWLKVIESMSICDDVANCIETSETVQTALSGYLSENGYSGGSSNGSEPPIPLTPSRTQENLLPSDYTCDNDHMFGMSRYVVQTLNSGTEQMLEILEVLTNPAELISVFVDNFEATSWAGGGLEFAAWIQDQLIEYYNASYSDTVEDTLACAIFCQIKDDCEMTLDDIIAAYEPLIFSTPPDTDDWLEILDWLISLTFNISVNTVATFHYFILQALRFGGNALSFSAGLRSFQLIAQLGKNETDDTWLTLCDDCATGWCNLFDFTLSDQSFGLTYPSRPYGIYVAGTGWQLQWATVSSVTDNRAYPTRNFGTSFTATEWIVRGTGLAGGAARGMSIVGRLSGSVVFSHSYGAYSTDGTTHDYVYNASHTVDEISIVVVSNLAATDQDAFTVESIQISGEVGDAPTSEDC